MQLFPSDVQIESASELPHAPDGVHAKVWRAFWAMLDVKLSPVTKTLTSLNLAVVELQQHAVHPAEFANSNANVQAVAHSSLPEQRSARCGHRQIAPSFNWIVWNKLTTIIEIETKPRRRFQADRIRWVTKCLIRKTCWTNGLVSESEICKSAMQLLRLLPKRRQ